MKKIIIFVLHIASLIFCSQYAASQTCSPTCTPQDSLNLSTGVDANGNLIPITPNLIDPFWRLINIAPPATNGCCGSPGVDPVQLPNSYIISPPTILTVWNKMPNANPLTVNGGNYYEANTIVNQPWRFRRQFCVCENNIVNLSGNFRADDGGTVTIKNAANNIVYSYGLPTPSPQIGQSNFIANHFFSQSNIALSAGKYYVEVDLINSGSYMGFALNLVLKSVNRSKTLVNPTVNCCEVNSLIYGQKVIDRNCNGSVDVSDTSGNGWVFNLLSGNTIIQTVTSSASGEFYFDNVDIGTYTIREVNQAGYAPTNPSSGEQTISITQNGSIKNVLFLNCCNTLNISNPDYTICNSTNTIIGTPNAAGFTYSWNPTTGLTSPTSSQTIASPTSSTRYILTYKSALGCTKKDTVNVRVETCPPACNLTANAGVDRAICPPSSTTIGSAAVSGNTYSWSSSPVGFTSTLANPTVTPSVPTTYYLIVSNTATQCVAKDTVAVRFNMNCPPPTCATSCQAKISSTNKISLTNNTTPAVSTLKQSFSFTGFPINITELSATVTDVKLWATNETGAISEQCIKCITNPIEWGSVINGNTIAGILPKININGTEVLASTSISNNQNPRQIIWKNGTVFSLNNPIDLNFYLPQVSTLSCCTRKANICVKFVFRNDKCEECIVNKCFDVDIK